MHRNLLIALLIPPLIVIVLAGVAGLRAWNGSRAIAEALSTAAAHVADVGATTRLEITPLVDAEAVDGLATATGVAYLIRTDTQTVLLDFGNATGRGPSAFEQNLKSLGLSLDEVDEFIISHPHPDHRGGGRNWLLGTFGTGSEQPDLQDKPVWAPVAMTYPSADPQVSGEAVVLGPGLATSGLLPFREVYPLTLLGGVSFEQALMVHVKDHGIVLVTGCGHPGIEALVTRAEALTGLPVVGLVGGLHLMDADAAALQPEIKFLTEQQIELVALSPHDSGEAARAAFSGAFPSAYQPVQVGRPIRFPSS